MTEIPDALAAELRPSMWADNWPHEKPDRPLSTIEAHQVMQRHAGCPIDECARKHHAKLVLIDAGELTPDTGRHQ